MAISREAVVAEALQWQGTRFHHNQSCKGHGCDCIGLIIGVFRELGGFDPSYRPPAYSQQWHAHKNEEVLVQTALSVGFREKSGDALPGDMLVFKFGRVASHAGIYLGNDEFIHAYFALGRVVKQPLRGDLQFRLRKIMTPPWLD